MKNLKYISIQLMLCCLLFTGCDKYLDIEPKGKTLLTTVTNYDQWLNNSQLGFGLSAATGGYINYLSDNADYVPVATPPTVQVDFVYTWQPQFSIVLNDSPFLWGQHYANINLFNTVIVGIDKAIGGTEAQKRSLKAEALLGRALEYFYLMNEYCQPYDPATAAQNPGVPYVTSNDVSQTTPPRGTLAEIYQHVIDDLNAAIPDLPLDNSVNRLRGSVGAAYSVLARVYFYAGNYAAAKTNAELALTNTKAVMVDYNGTLPATNFISTHPDVIYGRYMTAQVSASLDLMRTYAANDRRTRMMYLSADGYKFTTRGGTTFVPTLTTPVLGNTNTGTSVQEMKLIAAESATHVNELSQALSYLNEVRRNRYSGNTITNPNFTDYSSTVQEEVLQEILLERNREFPFNGLRWFDMRRLDRENRMGTVTRLNATGGVVATLPPHSKKYTLQIPYQVMSFNPGMEQNPY